MCASVLASAGLSRSKPGRPRSLVGPTIICRHQTKRKINIRISVHTKSYLCWAKNSGNDVLALVLYTLWLGLWAENKIVFLAFVWYFGIYLNSHVGDVSYNDGILVFSQTHKSVWYYGISVHKENSSSALQQAIRRPIRPGPQPRLAGIHQDQPHTQTRVAFSDLQWFVLSVPFARWMLMRHICLKEINADL